MREIWPKQARAPNSDLLLPCILPKLKLWGPVELVEKKYEILKEFSLKNKKSMKKKCCAILRSDEGDMAKTGLSAPSSDLLPCILPKLKLWGLVEPIEKNYEILTEFFLKNKESMKKIGTQFRGRMRKIWPKQAQVLRA